MLVTIQPLLNETSTQLASITDCPQLEAEILLSAALGKPRSFLHTWPDYAVPNEAITKFYGYIKRRLQQEPIAYITGQREFWSMTLSVNTDTLIPRPETEILVETILHLFPQSDQALQVADLGTGSGAIALALSHERPHWHLHATDLSEAALSVAMHNAKTHTLHQIFFHLGDWCAALPHHQFDIIVSNPPYIAETEWPTYAKGLQFEPEDALVSGSDGLSAIRRIIISANDYLKPSGYLLIEHGFAQGSVVRTLFAAAGFQQVHSVCDLSNQERITMGYK